LTDFALPSDARVGSSAATLAHLAGRVDEIAPFHVMELVKRATALEQAGRDIIHMSIGEPDFTAPEPVIVAASDALRRGVTQYTPALGLPALREAIASYYLDAFGVHVASERIIVTAGASGALLLACAALVDAGDEILMPDPCYPCNRHFVAAFGGVPTMVPSGPAQRFQLSAGDLADRWGARTRGVLLASPSNPTGTTIEATELARIVDIVRAHRGVTIIDEIYQGLTYDGPARTALALGEDIITVNSFSKYFAMTGWRLGWIVAPTAWVPAFEKLAQNLFICASTVAQHAALACFTPAARQICETRRLALKARRDYLVPALQGIGFDVPVVPDGAFYVYADCSKVRHPDAHDADALSHALLEAAGVAAVPGLDFGADAPRRYLRFSYATALPRIEEAIARMGALFRQSE